MKKLLLILCVCAGLYACTSDDDLVGSTSTGNSAEGVAFLRVNLKDVNSSTRATDGGFAYGTEAEQTINNAYFYLYDKDGKYIAYGSTGTVPGTATTDPTGDNIEWESTTQVAIWGLTDPSVPTMMVTVLNQPDNFTGVNMSLSQLEEALAGTPYGSNGNFVMSTSTYSSNGVINYTALTEEDFALEPINIEEDYADGGVDVYVERLAAKVSVSDGITTPSAANADKHIYTLTDEEKENFPMGTPAVEGTDVLAIQLLGFDVDCIARDAYISKNIDASWEFGSWIWNDADNFRSYWAESPNYGVNHTYPTTSKGNTDADEDTTPLDEYLRYVSLKDTIPFGTATYCGENTNTAAVLVGDTCTGITNLLVKAQFGTYSSNNSSLTGVDLVEYHGEYYTAEDFCEKTVEDVIDYDFTILVDSVIAYLKNDARYSSLGKYLDELNAAVIHDSIWCTDRDATTNLHHFGGEKLSLYNAYDGNVRIYYNMTTQPQWGTEGSFTDIDPTLAAKYPASDIVYGGADLDDYDLWFHVDQTQFEEGADWMLRVANLLKEIDGKYYMPIDNSISFTTGQGHTYTTRNYLLRAITEECDAIDAEFGSLYPNYYKNGLMYYHVPIQHLNTATGDTLVEAEYGVVRNHWYDVTITSLNSLGRGIAVEDEVIVPQKEIPYYYLGADINILSWKHVQQSVAW